MFEQDPLPMNNKRMLLGNAFYAGSWFFDWERCWIFCATELFYGTDEALRLARNANNCAEVDQRGVVNAGVRFWNKTRCICPERSQARHGFDRSAKIEKPRQNASSVTFDDRD